MFDADTQSRSLRAAGGGALGGILLALLVPAVSWWQTGEPSWAAEAFVVTLAFCPLVGAIAGGLAGYVVGRITAWAGREMTTAARVLAAVAVIFCSMSLLSATRGRADGPAWVELLMAVLIGVPAGLLARPKPDELGNESAVPES